MILLLDIVARTSFHRLLVGCSRARSSRNRSAALRHVTLAMTLVAAVAVVPLTMVLPRWNPLPLHVEVPRHPDPSRLISPGTERADHASQPARDRSGARAVPALPSLSESCGPPAWPCSV